MLAQIGSLDVAPGTLVAAWMDAHRHEVFTAVYRAADAAPFTPARLVEIEGPAVGDPAATLARWAARVDSTPAVFIGEGAVMYASQIVAAHPAAHVLPPPLIAAHSDGSPSRGTPVNRAGSATAALRAADGRRDHRDLAREEENFRRRRGGHP